MKTVLRRYNHNGQCITNTDLSKHIMKKGFYVLDCLNQFVYANKRQIFISDMITIKHYDETGTTITVLNKYPSGLSKKNFSRPELLKLNTVERGPKEFIGKNLNADLRTPKFYHHPTLTFYTSNENTTCFDIEVCGDTEDSNMQLNNLLPDNIPKINFEPRHNYLCFYISKPNNGFINPNDITLYLGTRFYKNKLSFGVSYYVCKNVNEEIQMLKPVGNVQKCEPYSNDRGLKCYDKHISYILIYETIKIKLFMLMQNFEQIGILDE